MKFITGPSVGIVAAALVVGASAGSVHAKKGGHGVGACHFNTDLGAYVGVKCP